MATSLIERVQPHSATVTTATVSIKTVTINDKQLTLSAFRQIEPSELIVWYPETDTLDYFGNVWGRVNYFWPKCHHFQYSPSHIHILWEFDGQLFLDGIPNLAEDYFGYSGVTGGIASQWGDIYHYLANHTPQLFIAV